MKSDKDFTSNTNKTDEAAASLALKREGTKRVLENEKAELKRALFEAICYRADTGQPFTANDIRDDLGDEIMDGLHHPNAFSSAFHHAARDGVIKKTLARKQSTRRKAHGRDLTVWVGA